MLFFDKKIFVNADDYIIGGCYFEEGVSATTEGIRHRTEARIRRLIETYISDYINHSPNRDAAYASAIANLQRLVITYLTVTENDCGEVTEAEDFTGIILNSPEMSSWLFNIGERVKNKNLGFIKDDDLKSFPEETGQPIENIDAGGGMTQPDDITELEAKDYTDVASIHELLESLKNLND